MGLILFLTVTVIFLLSWAVAANFTQNQRTVNRRLQKYVAVETAAEEDSEPSFLAVQRQRINPYLKRFNLWFLSLPKVATVDLRMQQAGIPLQGSEFILLQCAASGGMAFLMLLFSGGLLRMVIMGCLTALLFIVYVRLRIVRRKLAFTNQLGDALSMMANAMRSGFSFMQAMETVGKEMGDPIATEFRRALREIQFGVLTDEALNHLGRRLESKDLDLVITAIAIQRQVGGNLAQIFDIISETVNERIRMKAEVRTLTAQGRLSGWIVGSLPFVLALFILLFVNPGYFDLLVTDPIGRFLIGLGLVSQMIGALVIKRITDIEM